MLFYEKMPSCSPASLCQAVVNGQMSLKGEPFKAQANAPLDPFQSSASVMVGKCSELNNRKRIVSLLRSAAVSRH